MGVVVLNPGQMGSALGAALVEAGQDAAWVSEGRGEASAKRAAEVGLRAINSFGDLRSEDVVFSIVPPANAVELATAVAGSGFSGTFVDANAVSPATGMAVAKIITDCGASYVDGGIIGLPPKARGTTRLYLAGPQAAVAAALFDGSRMDARVIDETAGSCAASALKMAYAGWTKASAALLMTARALARAKGVEQALLDEWAISIPDLGARSDAAATANASKAWRFVGEMHEIADSMASANLPEGFHRGAAELYERLADFKDQEGVDPQGVYAKLAGPR
jgi:3-hydroxyisobutyrate dehydrogenase-like beta-hydroxyacid dehydrogenase